MKDIIRIKDQFYIRADSSLADEQTRVLKHSDTFAIFDRHGDIRPLGFENHGLFFEGTRFLSRSRVFFHDKSLLLLSSNVKEDNDFLVVDLTNAAFKDTQGGFVPQGTLHFVRTIFLYGSCLFEQFHVTNYGSSELRFTLGLEFEADYIDIFELRGMSRERRGLKLKTRVRNQKITMAYEGLDKTIRKTEVGLPPGARPTALGDRINIPVRLKAGGHKTLEFSVRCLLGRGASGRLPGFFRARSRVRKAYHEYKKETCRIETSNEQFNDWLNQSRADLHMLLTKTKAGLYPFAGIPWFSTIFGRDGIITAMETLWFYPDIARGVLAYLALTQAREEDPARDAEPGKILHEERKGEMAALGEIPFGTYYGTIDATPLFIVLAGQYYDRTADITFIRKIWPNIANALGWIDAYGDLDKDGFVEYQRKVVSGLQNQGWKDSDDSIFHQHGALAEPPLALCEVQGYVYEAKRSASHLARRLGLTRQAVKLAKEASSLKKKFADRFWSKKISSYAIALDGGKKTCEIRSSNAGHCLFTGIADPLHAKQIAQWLMESGSFTGWGIRTVPAGEARFNPMSYHNGSIWPHDNAIIAAGLSRYGFKEAAARLLKGLFDTSLFLDLHRLPELFCGFERREGEGPTLYPVACDPQAWAAGSVFLVLQACLGLSVQAEENKLFLDKPFLPQFLEEVKIHDLKVRDCVLDIFLYRQLDSGVSVDVRRKKGHVDVVITK